MSPIEFRALALRIRPSPGTNDHEVCILGDGEDLLARYWNETMGLDPDDLLIEPSLLRATPEPHSATIARCKCGVIECGSEAVEVRLDGEMVSWTSGDRTFLFPAGQYEAEVRRAERDTSWETPDRSAARLVRDAVDRAALSRHGLRFQWASGRVEPGKFTVSLVLEPGPYQVLVAVPVDQQVPEEVASASLEELRRDPRSWKDVRYSPQEPDLGPPDLAGDGWRRFTL